MDDIAVLTWAAIENRALLTHDVTTVTDYAYLRAEQGQLQPGIFEILSDAAIGPVIADILLIDECSNENEWVGQIIYLPFR